MKYFESLFHAKNGSNVTDFQKTVKKGEESFFFCKPVVLFQFVIFC